VSSLAEPGWEAVARDPRFVALVSERRRFVVRATAFYCAYLLAYLALLGFAKDFMAREVAGSVSLAIVGGLSICVLAVVMAAMYVRRSERWDRMAEEVRR
jgi:uncharacterized membrane protein (DUF485 family)